MEAFVIPDIYCPFPSLISPHLEQVRVHLMEWIRHFGLIPQGSTARSSLAPGVPQIACRMYPRAGLEELSLICDWICWAFFYDDQLDNSERKTQLTFIYAVHKHLLALLSDSPGTSPRGAIAEALDDIWRRAGSLTSPAWQRRFAWHHDEFFAGQRWEALNRIQRHIPGVQTYISKRRDAGGSAIGCDFIELAGHFEVPAQLYDGQSLQAVLRAAQNIACWNNDVYSLQKELACGETNNLVILVQREQGCSLQEAVNQVCATIETETRHFLELIQLLPPYPPPMDRSMHDYLVDVGSWIRGTLDAQREASRYKDKKYSEPGCDLGEILSAEQARENASLKDNATFN